MSKKTTTPTTLKAIRVYLRRKHPKWTAKRLNAAAMAMFKKGPRDGRGGGVGVKGGRRADRNKSAGSLGGPGYGRGGGRGGGSGRTDMSEKDTENFSIWDDIKQVSNDATSAIESVYDTTTQALHNTGQSIAGAALSGADVVADAWGDVSRAGGHFGLGMVDVGRGLGGLLHGVGDITGAIPLISGEQYNLERALGRVVYGGKNIYSGGVGMGKGLLQGVDLLYPDVSLWNVSGWPTDEGYEELTSIQKVDDDVRKAMEDGGYVNVKDVVKRMGSGGKRRVNETSHEYIRRCLGLSDRKSLLARSIGFAEDGWEPYRRRDNRTGYKRGRPGDYEYRLEKPGLVSRGIAAGEHFGIGLEKGGAGLGRGFAQLGRAASSLIAAPFSLFRMRPADFIANILESVINTTSGSLHLLSAPAKAGWYAGKAAMIGLGVHGATEAFSEEGGDLHLFSAGAKRVLALGEVATGAELGLSKPFYKGGKSRGKVTNREITAEQYQNIKGGKTPTTAGTPKEQYKAKMRGFKMEKKEEKMATKESGKRVKREGKVLKQEIKAIKARLGANKLRSDIRIQKAKQQVEKTKRPGFHLGKTREEKIAAFSLQRARALVKAKDLKMMNKLENAKEMLRRLMPTKLQKFRTKEARKAKKRLVKETVTRERGTGLAGYLGRKELKRIDAKLEKPLVKRIMSKILGTKPGRLEGDPLLTWARANRAARKKAENVAVAALAASDQKDAAEDSRRAAINVRQSAVEKKAVQFALGTLMAADTGEKLRVRRWQELRGADIAKNIDRAIKKTRLSSAYKPKPLQLAAPRKSRASDVRGLLARRQMVNRQRQARKDAARMRRASGLPPTPKSVKVSRRKPRVQKEVKLPKVRPSDALRAGKDWYKMSKKQQDIYLKLRRKEKREGFSESIVESVVETFADKSWLSNALDTAGNIVTGVIEGTVRIPTDVANVVTAAITGKSIASLKKLPTEYVKPIRQQSAYQIESEHYAKKVAVEIKKMGVLKERAASVERKQRGGEELDPRFITSRRKNIEEAMGYDAGKMKKLGDLHTYLRKESMPGGLEGGGITPDFSIEEAIMTGMMVGGIAKGTLKGFLRRGAKSASKRAAGQVGKKVLGKAPPKMPVKPTVKVPPTPKPSAAFPGRTSDAIDDIVTQVLDRTKGFVNKTRGPMSKPGARPRVSGVAAPKVVPKTPAPSRMGQVGEGITVSTKGAERGGFLGQGGLVDKAGDIALDVITSRVPGKIIRGVKVVAHHAYRPRAAWNALRADFKTMNATAKRALEAHSSARLNYTMGAGTKAQVAQTRAALLKHTGESGKAFLVLAPLLLAEFVIGAGGTLVVADKIAGKVTEGSIFQQAGRGLVKTAAGLGVIGKPVGEEFGKRAGEFALGVIGVSPEDIKETAKKAFTPATVEQKEQAKFHIRDAAEKAKVGKSPEVQKKIDSVAGGIIIRIDGAGVGELKNVLAKIASVNFGETLGKWGASLTGGVADVASAFSKAWVSIGGQTDTQRKAAGAGAPRGSRRRMRESRAVAGVLKSLEKRFAPSGEHRRLAGLKTTGEKLKYPTLKRLIDSVYNIGEERHELAVKMKKFMQSHPNLYLPVPKKKSGSVIDAASGIRDTSGKIISAAKGKSWDQIAKDFVKWMVGTGVKMTKRETSKEVAKARAEMERDAGEGGYVSEKYALLKAKQRYLGKSHKSAKFQLEHVLAESKRKDEESRGQGAKKELWEEKKAEAEREEREGERVRVDEDTGMEDIQKVVPSSLITDFQKPVKRKELARVDTKVPQTERTVAVARTPEDGAAWQTGTTVAGDTYRYKPARKPDKSELAPKETVKDKRLLAVPEPIGVDAVAGPDVITPPPEKKKKRVIRRRKVKQPELRVGLKGKKFGGGGFQFSERGIKDMVNIVRRVTS